ncbi:hypothetical protein B0H11DRAFT_2329735 [Mycena galericulata]|nr:hypothetical protein B0H11DRAFT_2329735 [Mycena galericulata]
MTSYRSFVSPASSAESTVFLELSQSTSRTGVSKGSGGGSPFPPPESTPERTPIHEPPPPSQFTTSFESGGSPSPALSSTVAGTTNTTLLSATVSPQASSSSTQDNALPLDLIIGASVTGMVLGALIVTFFFFYRRRRAQHRAQQQGVDPFNLDEEKKVTSLDVPYTAPGTPRTSPNNNRVMDWIQRNRVVSVSTISSFSSPTVLESVGARTSISAYSQVSALASGASGDLTPEEGGLSRPPGLDRINE